MGEFIDGFEAMQILNIQTKQSLSRLLKQKGIKPYGKKLPYNKNEILELANERSKSKFTNQNLLRELPQQTPKKELPPLQPLSEDEVALNEACALKSAELKAKLKNIGFYESVDDELISLYSKTLVMANSASNALIEQGFYTYNMQGDKLISPELNAFNMLSKNLISISKQLGIGANSRANLKKAEVKTISPFDDILKGK